MDNNLENLSNLFKFKMAKFANNNLESDLDLLERAKLLQEKIANCVSYDYSEEDLILNVLKEKYKNG